MAEAFICDSIRTPVGRFGGSLAAVRPDDLLAHTMRTLMERNPGVDWSATDDVMMGAANQAGEDNRNVGRMAVLLSGMDAAVPGTTINRLCGSGMEAVGYAARSIKTGEADLILAGGVESMSRAPKVMAKAETAYSQGVEVYDTTIGWRFTNPALAERFGKDEMPGTAENVAVEFEISRADQDKFALRSQQRTAAAVASGRLADEIVPVTVPQRRGASITVDRDEHPRPDTSFEKLAALRPIFEDGTVTAGNASGINDGAAAVLVASEQAIAKYGLTPQARVIGMATAGVPPRIMGIGPVPATQRLLGRAGVALDDIGVIELNEAFASQALACLRQLGLADDAEHVNANGGAIAIGHPLGMTGARLVTTAVRQLHQTDERYALTTMCIGVGQGIAMLVEKV
ncbi:MAG: 3-oxoadipyl-CoA thiolase [Acidimicrobiia bacterium]|nr:3-oxoadipyl-CoA thiolase [Acidimicrobiia bacterium]MDX2467533.1 3-oxoadipyl-CoA thiolase [Acidimicrobiia bacterium]